MFIVEQDIPSFDISHKYKTLFQTNCNKPTDHNSHTQNFTVLSRTVNHHLLATALTKQMHVFRKAEHCGKRSWRSRCLWHDDLAVCDWFCSHSFFFWKIFPSPDARLNGIHFCPSKKILQRDGVSSRDPCFCFPSVNVSVFCELSQGSELRIPRSYVWESR